MVNHGEEKVRVHMNVVPRSTMNTNGETENQLLSVNLCANLDFNGRSNPEVVGSIPPEVKRFFLYLVWFLDSLY